MGSGQGDQAQEGRETLEKQAASDPTVAGRILGEAFLLGRLTPEPAPETAAKWWLKASNAGDVPSMVLLARLYDGQFGRTSLVNAKTAYEYFLKAAEKGDASAMVAVGIRLLKSDAVAPDEKKGIEWLNKAVEAKNYAGLLALGDYQANIKEDPKAALVFYDKGAEAGHAECMLRAASLYMEGKGTKKNTEYAVELLEKSSKAGNAQAHLFLASAIMAEESPDIGKAYGHLLTAANSGLPLAQNELGLFYLSGKMGVADISAALSGSVAQHKPVFLLPRTTLAPCMSAVRVWSKTTKMRPNSTHSPPNRGMRVRHLPWLVSMRQAPPWRSTSHWRGRWLIWLPKPEKKKVPKRSSNRSRKA